MATHVPIAAASLSPRETEILRMLGRGSSNCTIARVLQISERTVKAHVTSVLLKLGLESRLQAGLYAVTYGLSEFDGERPGAGPVAQRSHGGARSQPTDS